MRSCANQWTSQRWQRQTALCLAASSSPSWTFSSTSCPPAQHLAAASQPRPHWCWLLVQTTPSPPRRPSQRPPAARAALKAFSVMVQPSFARRLQLLWMRSSSIQRAIYQDETNESLRQLSEHPSKANSALLPKRVGVFNIVERRRRCHLGTSLAFHQSAISFSFSLFFGGGLLFFSLSPTLSEKQRYKDPEQSFFIVLHLKYQLLLCWNLTGNLDLGEVDVFPIKALGILWNLFVMHVKVLLVFQS